METLILIIVVGTSVWMAFDAHQIGYRKGDVKGMAGMGPLGWLVAGLLLWIVAFPLYLASRGKLKQAAAKAKGANAADGPEAEPVTTKSSRLVPLGSVLVLLLVALPVMEIIFQEEEEGLHKTQTVADAQTPPASAAPASAVTATQPAVAQKTALSSQVEAAIDRQARAIAEGVVADPAGHEVLPGYDHSNLQVACPALNRWSGDGAGGSWTSVCLISASATSRPIVWVVTAWRSDASAQLDRTSLLVLAKRSYEDDQQFSARYSNTLNELVMQVMEGAV